MKTRIFLAVLSLLLVGIASPVQAEPCPDSNSECNGRDNSAPPSEGAGENGRSEEGQAEPGSDRQDGRANDGNSTDETPDEQAESTTTSDESDGSHSDTSSDGTSDSSTAQADGKPSKEYCDRYPGDPQCVRQQAGNVCTEIIIHGLSPQIGVWDPILGIVEVDLDKCYRVYREIFGELVLVFSTEEN